MVNVSAGMVITQDSSPEDLRQYVSVLEARLAAQNPADVADLQQGLGRTADRNLQMTSALQMILDLRHKEPCGAVMRQVSEIAAQGLQQDSESLDLLVRNAMKIAWHDGFSSARETVSSFRSRVAGVETGAGPIVGILENILESQDLPDEPEIVSRAKSFFRDEANAKHQARQSAKRADWAAVNTAGVRQ